MSGLTPEFHFALVLTDAEGNHPRQVWNHVESGPGYNIPHLVSWRADGEVIYLTQRAYMVAWSRFNYRPAMLALNVSTGQATQIGDDAADDAAVSPDGRWLVQAFHSQPEDKVLLRSLVDGTERTIIGTEGTGKGGIGDFSFAPGNRWLAWQECVGFSSSSFRLRALRLPDGEPFTVYEADVAEQVIAGWMGPDDLVIMRTLPAGSSYLIPLPSEGPGCKFSPYDFLGVLGEAPVP